MGQISVPAMNKTGYSMYWSSMWDDKHNFSKSMKEDIFIKKFIPTLLNDNSSINFKNFYINENFLHNVNAKYKLQLNIKNNFNEIYNHIQYLNKISFYLSKIWILKYQTWILIYMYVYSPTFNKLNKKSNFEETQIDNSIFYNIFYNYYTSLIKVNYKYDFFKKSFKKNFF